MVIQFLKIIRKPGTWLWILLFLFITLLQYAELIEGSAFINYLINNIGLTRYTVERILYLLPIIWASFLFGWKGGTITSFAAVVCMLPRDLLISASPADALVETSAVFIVGNLVSYSIESLRKERNRRAQLEAAQDELKSHLQVIEANEKQLAALNKTSGIISQFLEINQVLESAVDCVIDVTGVETVQIYMLDDEAAELSLAIHRGLSDEFVQGVGKLKIGEGFNGNVAETGEPLFVEDASKDPRLTKALVRKENLRSQLIVPIRSKGKVSGTLCLASRSYRSFPKEEVNLLIAIGNQIGVSVENARLYEKERQFTEQLRVSEYRYRELFENAYDAIWLNDLNGRIVAANRACSMLTGYTLEELLGLTKDALLSADSLETTNIIEHRLLKGEMIGAVGEVKMVKKDGAEAIVQLAASLVSGDGEPTAFQHVARDITGEKRMQENLHFLLQQITRAQEEERKRIARELHDDTLQALVVHSQQIYNIVADTEGMPVAAIHRLKELRKQANNIMQGLRLLSRDLRPASLDRLGLVPALTRLVSDAKEYSGIDISIQVLGAERRLPNEVELVLFRIAQEALRNVWKHSQATSSEITLEFDKNKTTVTVMDNGIGFDATYKVDDLPRYGKLGLAGMSERATLLNGTLIVRSEVGKGTTLTAELPV